VVVQTLAARLAVPAIVTLLAAGLLLGPDVLNPFANAASISASVGGT
jgi:NhaP-type Na+/H+ or K+/H+ antiporter